MSKSKVLAFVDCNILIEGFLDPMHPARGVIIMAANNRLDLITCAKVVNDIEDVILEEAETLFAESGNKDWRAPSALPVRIWRWLVRDSLPQ